MEVVVVVVVVVCLFVFSEVSLLQHPLPALLYLDSPVKVGEVGVTDGATVPDHLGAHLSSPHPHTPCDKLAELRTDPHTTELLY